MTTRDVVAAMRERAEREPLYVDISDYSDDFCAGFLRGQTHALDEVLAAFDASGPGAGEPDSREPAA